MALVTSPHPAARIVAIDKAAALAMPGVHYVLDGRELAAATLPMMTGLDPPKVPRRPLAVDAARYAGEWVAAVVADTRALAEDAAEHVASTMSRCPMFSMPKRHWQAVRRRSTPRTARTCSRPQLRVGRRRA